MTDDKKTYTVEEIKKIAPGYKGKVENFNPAKVGKGSQRQRPKKTRNTLLPAPTNPGLAPTSTAQRNESIISKAIFGVDVSVTEIAPRQLFLDNYAKLVDLAVETYDGYRADEKQLDRVFVREEMSYYATALLHLKLIEVKAKQGDENLTSQEKDLRKATNV